MHAGGSGRCRRHGRLMVVARAQAAVPVVNGMISATPSLDMDAPLSQPFPSSFIGTLIHWQPLLEHHFTTGPIFKANGWSVGLPRHCQCPK